jgi:hypothetical protein
MKFSKVNARVHSKKDLINGDAHLIDKQHYRIISRTNSFLKKDAMTDKWKRPNKSNATLEYSTYNYDKLYTYDNSANTSILDISQRKTLARKMLMYFKQSPSNARVPSKSDLPPLNLTKATAANLFLRKALKDNTKHIIRRYFAPTSKGPHLIIHMPKLSAAYC